METRLERDRKKGMEVPVYSKLRQKYHDYPAPTLTFFTCQSFGCIEKSVDERVGLEVHAQGMKAFRHIFEVQWWHHLFKSHSLKKTRRKEWPDPIEEKRKDTQ